MKNKNSIYSKIDTVFVSGYIEEIIYNLVTKDSSTIIKLVFGIHHVQTETIGLYKNSYLSISSQKGTIFSCKSCVEKWKKQLLSDKKFNWKSVNELIYFSDQFWDDYKLTIVNQQDKLLVYEIETISE